MPQFKLTLLLALFGCSLVVNGSPIVNQFTKQFNLDASLETLFPATATLDELNQKLEQASQCYEPELVGQNVDIFEREASIKSIVDQYYQAFPHKTITEESIQSLISSITEIMNSCLSSETQSTRYGFTELSDMSDAQIRALSGAEAPSFSNLTQQSFGDVMLSGGDAACRHHTKAIPAAFDWRHHGAVTPVRNQAQCGSCWAFATVATIESAYLIHKKTKDTHFALSEQQVTSCSKANGCKGGNAMTAFSYIQKHGLISAHNYPYNAHDNGCNTHKHTAAAKIKNFCVRSKFRYTTNFHVEALSDHAMQESLINYGPVYVNVEANPAWTRNYRGGVVHGPCGTATNHAVLIVGYTKGSWIIKNSWGTSWGKGGYFELARGKNVCGIHTEIAFPLL